MRHNYDIELLSRLVLETDNNSDVARKYCKIKCLDFSAKQRQVRNKIVTEGLRMELVVTGQKVGKNGELTSETLGVRNAIPDTEGMSLKKVTKSPYGGAYVTYEKDLEQSQEYISRLLESYSKSFKRVKPRKIKGSGIYVVSLADFHFGANVKSILNTPDFNIDILTRQIKNVCKRINKLNAKEIHLSLLGDFVESISGLNHINVWQELSTWGCSAIEGIANLIYDELINKINNLKKVYIVSGNHDRLSANREVDVKGEAAAIMAGFLKLRTTIAIDYNPVLLNPEIDGVKYIMTHGHYGLSKNDIGSFLFQFGDQSKYNIILEGHLHSRIVTKGKVKKSYNFSNTKVVSFDSCNYRKIVVPPMFTGNFYSASNGWSSTAGMTIISNEQGINHRDIEIRA